MAATFESSSHAKRWIRSQREIMLSNSADKAVVPAEEVERLRLFFVEFLHRLGKYLKLRQRVVSTAVVFFKRFYLNRSFCEDDPRIFAPTLLFLAAKAEETFLNAKVFIRALKSSSSFTELYRGDTKAYDIDLDISMIIKNEPEALQQLDLDLIVYHPYRPITMILNSTNKHNILQVCWSMANDSYRTDLALQYPPAKIAVAVIYLSCVLDGKKKREVGNDPEKFLDQVEANQDDVLDIVARLLRLYRYYSDEGNTVMEPAAAAKALRKLTRAHIARGKTEADASSRNDGEAGPKMDVE